VKQIFCILSCSYPCINITILNKYIQMHSYINKTPFYYLYIPFQHVSTLKGPSSESTIDTFQWHIAIGMCTAEMYQLHLAAGMYHLYSLRTALWGLKHVEVTYNVNKEEFNNIWVHLYEFAWHKIFWILSKIIHVITKAVPALYKVRCSNLHL